jgi:hypothetical protein
MNIICRINGHQTPARAEYPTVGCKRCGKDWESVDRDCDFIGVRHWLLWRVGNVKYRIRRAIRDAREWWHCPDCGARFGAHSADCMVKCPF